MSQKLATKLIEQYFVLETFQTVPVYSYKSNVMSKII